MEKLDTYKEIGINYRYFLDWRHKLLAGYLVSVAGLSIGFSWSITHEETKHISGIVLFLGCALSLVFWGLDYRNRDLYHLCQKVGAQIEKKEGIQNGQGIYSSLEESSSILSHSVVLNVMFLFASIIFFIGGILAFTNWNLNNSFKLLSLTPIISTTLLLIIAILTYRLNLNVHKLDKKPILFLTVNKHNSEIYNCWYVHNGSKSAALNLLVRFKTGSNYSKWVACNSLAVNEKFELIWISNAEIIDVCYSDIECKKFYKLEFQNYKGEITEIQKNIYNKFSEDAEKEGKNIAILTDVFSNSYSNKDRNGFIQNYVLKELF